MNSHRIIVKTIKASLSRFCDEKLLSKVVIDEATLLPEYECLSSMINAS